MTQPIITDFPETDRQRFGRGTINLGHSISGSGLFTDEALADVIEASDTRTCHVNTMDVIRHDPSSRREGIIDGLSGLDVLDAVARGRIWILLRNPEQADSRYGNLLKEIYREFEAAIPGLKTFRHKMSILISSPYVQVYYHADVPGQTLWQIRGSKRVWIYPNTEPFLSQPALERIVMGEAHEISLDYHETFDAHAEVIRLGPGRMLHWPLNCPHRIVNDGCLNVSLTTEHWTAELRNAYAANYANGLLRRTFHLGDRELPRPLNGPGLYARAAVAAAHKLSGIARRRAHKYPIDFKLNPNSPAAIQSIPAELISK